MKTIKDKAAEFNYYQLDNIPQNALKDAWFNDRLEWYKESYNKKIIPESLKELNFQIGVFMKVKQQLNSMTNEHELYFCDHCYILIYDVSNDILLQLSESRGKYWFYPIHEVINRLTANMSSDQRQDAIKGIKEPNQIGVFTANKVLAYFEYCKLYVGALKNKAILISNKESLNRIEIENFIKSLNNPKVTNHKNVYWIDTNYFEVKFELVNNGTYLDKTIKYKGTLSDILTIENK